MVVDMAVRDNPDALNWSFLYPACGSGIFLVILFNRLANHWIISRTDHLIMPLRLRRLNTFWPVRFVELTLKKLLAE